MTDFIKNAFTLLMITSVITAMVASSLLPVYILKTIIQEWRKELNTK